MNFNHPDLVVQSWYPAMRSRRLRRGRARSLDLLRRRIVLFRDESGAVHALDGQCPHLGADLGLGTVEGTELRCAYHHWCFGGD